LDRFDEALNSDFIIPESTANVKPQLVRLGQVVDFIENASG
jgi:hypothetical protein